MLHVLRHWRSKESAKPLFCTVTKGTSFVGTVKALLTAGILYPCMSSHYSTFSVQKVFENKTLRGFIGPWCFCTALHASTPYTWRDVNHSDFVEAKYWNLINLLTQVEHLTEASKDQCSLPSNKTHPWSCLRNNRVFLKCFLVCYLSIKDMSCKDHGSAGTVRRCL